MPRYYIDIGYGYLFKMSKILPISMPRYYIDIGYGNLFKMSKI